MRQNLNITRTIVRKKNTGQNIVTRLSVKKYFSDGYDLQHGDIVWVEVKRIIKGDTNDKKNFRIERD